LRKDCGMSGIGRFLGLVLIVAVAVGGYSVWRTNRDIGRTERTAPDSGDQPSPRRLLGRWRLAGEGTDLELRFKEETVEIQAGGHRESMSYRIIDSGGGELRLEATTKDGTDDVRIRFDGSTMHYTKKGVTMRFERIGGTGD